MKNLKIYLSSLAICSTFCFTSCGDSITAFYGDNDYDDALFYKKYGYSFKTFVDDNHLIPCRYMEKPSPYYEFLVSKARLVNGELVFIDSWEKVDNIEGRYGIARLVNVYYKFVSVDFNDDGPVIKEKITADFYELENGYDYMYKDDYIVYEKTEPFYVSNGKFLRRVK